MPDAAWAGALAFAWCARPGRFTMVTALCSSSSTNDKISVEGSFEGIALRVLQE
jgi:hypothetical protein